MQQSSRLLLPGLEFSDPRGGGGDFHGLLSASHHHLSGKRMNPQTLVKFENGSAKMQQNHRN